MTDPLNLKPGIKANRILVKYSSTVTNVFKANLVHINNRLLEEGLVARGVYDPGSRSFTSDESASKLYQACIATVENDPSKFPTLMDVLSEYQLLEGAVEEMTATGKHPLFACMPFNSNWNSDAAWSKPFWTYANRVLLYIYILSMDSQV